MNATIEKVMLAEAFQAACQRYAHGNGSSEAIAAAAVSALSATRENGELLLGMLRGIANDEARGVDKDRRRGAEHACQRCIAAVDSWLRGQPKNRADGGTKS